MVFKSFARSRFARVLPLFLFLFGMAASPPLVGGPAPSFQLKGLDGSSVKISDLKGKFVVLNFWATWCAPCTREMPELQKAHRSLNDHIAIVGINLAESKEKVAEFTQERHLDFPVLLDEYGNVSQKYQVVHLPVTYIISPDGIIRDKVFGGGLTQKMIEARIEQLR